MTAIPEGYHSLTPYLIVEGAHDAIDFYKKGFGAIETMRMETPDNKIGHAELVIGDSKFMLADQCPEMNARNPHHYGGSPVSMHLYVDDVDSFVATALEHGAKLTRPIADQFYGDRSGLLEDPFGHIWCVSTHVEEVSEAEMKKRMTEISKYK